MQSPQRSMRNILKKLYDISSFSKGKYNGIITIIASRGGNTVPSFLQIKLTQSLSRKVERTPFSLVADWKNPQCLPCCQKFIDNLNCPGRRPRQPLSDRSSIHLSMFWPVPKQTEPRSPDCKFPEPEYSPNLRRLPLSYGESEGPPRTAALCLSLAKYCPSR